MLFTSVIAYIRHKSKMTLIDSKMPIIKAVVENLKNSQKSFSSSCVKITHINIITFKTINIK